MQAEGGPFDHRSVLLDDIWICRVCRYESATMPAPGSAGCPQRVDVQATIHTARRPTTEGEDRALREFWRGGGDGE